MTRGTSSTAATEHFVTLFDYRYSLRGLALYRSLIRHCSDFTLWVIAMDRDTEKLLVNLNLPSLKVIALADLETSELIALKDSRSFAEYCWTLTPFTFDAVFGRDDSVRRVTYVDADVWLRGSPKRVLGEFASSRADVMITEHAYHPAFDASATSGIYCVQFLAVNRSRNTEVIEKWGEQCLDWCFAYFDRGRFGDQGYLNQWPENFGSAVYAPPRKELFQGPWNAMRFPFGEALIYHFHSLNILGSGKVSVGVYPIPKPHRKYVYVPYIQDLIWSENQIKSVGMGIPPFAGVKAQLFDFLHRVARLKEIITTH